MDRRRRKSREAILRAFLQTFFEQGYGRLSIGAVAAAADVGRSTLYTHFRRKEDLLRASMEGLLAGLASIVEPAETDATLRLLRHFWDNRKHRAIFAPGAARNVLAAALAELIEARLRDPALFAPPRWRVPVALAARLVADHQLNLLDRWLTGREGPAPAVMAVAMRDSSRALCASLHEV